MPRIFDGKIYRDMTPEEEQEYLRQQAEQEAYDCLHPPVPTAEERISDLEREIFELKGGKS